MKQMKKSWDEGDVRNMRRKKSVERNGLIREKGEGEVTS